MTKLSVVPTTPSEAAKKQRREVYDLIDAAYNANRQCYKANVQPNTDGAIAEAVGCSESLVAGVREEFFGPPGTPEPPDIKRIETSIAELQKDAQGMELTAKGLRQQAAELRGRATELQKELDRLCAEYGWNGDAA